MDTTSTGSSSGMSIRRRGSRGSDAWTHAALARGLDLDLAAEVHAALMHGHIQPLAASANVQKPQRFTRL